MTSGEIVWVVLCHIAGEEEFIGVYSSREKAEEAVRAAAVPDLGNAVNYVVVEWGVDQGEAQQLTASTSLADAPPRSTPNERAADWWAERFEVEARREEFREALLARLPDGDWMTTCDYDPRGHLLQAIQAIGIPCDGFGFSANGLLPQKTSLRREGDLLYGKEGRGAGYFLVEAER